MSRPRPPSSSFPICKKKERSSHEGQDGRREFSDLHRLRPYDYAIAGAAGILAALIDIFLVQVPRHPGFLGGHAAPGGWLSNVLKDRFSDRVLPAESISKLERHFYVPYDASTNRNLQVPVPGLGPRMHRLHSLCHDPVLCWMFGVRDELTGQFSAIGKDGRFVVQRVAGARPVAAGQRLFIRLFEAFRAVGGNLLSDVNTPAGLPPPLAVLSQFLQRGSIGPHKYSVASVVRGMYRSGYDFRHLLAGSVPVVLIEVMVRIGYFVERLHAGERLRDAIPVASNSRLCSQFFLAHSVAAAVNAGKVAVTKNPLAINWAQWLAFFRYLPPQAYWVVVGKENARGAFVEQRIESEFQEQRQQLQLTWDAFRSPAQPVAVL